MQRIKSRKPEAIGALKEVKELSHELRRTRVRCIPHFGDNQIVGADQLQLSAWAWFVDHNLRTSGVQDAAVHQVSVYIVKAHCPLFAAAHAAGLKLVALRLSHSHISESLRRLPPDSEKFTCIGLLVPCHLLILCRRVRVAILRHAARRADVHENESNHGILKSRRPAFGFHSDSCHSCPLKMLAFRFPSELGSNARSPSINEGEIDPKH